MSINRQVQIVPNGHSPALPPLNLPDPSNSQQQLDRLKRPKACTNCRKSKIKCIKDDQGQTCKRCKAQGLQCIYEFKVPSYKVAMGTMQQSQQPQPTQQTHTHTHAPNPTQSHIINSNIDKPSSYLPAISLSNTQHPRPGIPPINSILNTLNNKTGANGISSNEQFQNIPRLLNPVNTNNVNNNSIISPLNPPNGNNNNSKNTNHLPNALITKNGFNNWENSVEERLEGFGSKLGAILTLLQNQQQQSTSTLSSPTVEEPNEKKRELEDIDAPINKRQKTIMAAESIPSSVPESPRSSEDYKEVEIVDPVISLHRILTKDDARELFNFFNSNISPQLFGFDVSSYSIDDIWDTCPLLIATIGCIASIHHPLLSHLSPSLEKIIYDISKDIFFNIPKTEIEAFNTIVALCFCGFWFKNKQMFTGLAIQLARTMNLISPSAFKSSSKSFIPKKERLKLWYLLYILDGQQTLVFNRQSMFDSNDKSFKNSKELLIEAESEDNKFIKDNIKDVNEDNEDEDIEKEVSDVAFNANYSDIRLISQVEYHQAINAVFDGSAWDLLTPSSFGLPFKTNLELDKWMVQWTVLLSPFNNHPVWSSKSTLIYYNFAKLHINSSAVRKFQAMGTNLPSFDELDDDFFEDVVETTDGVEAPKEKKIEEVSVYNDEEDSDEDDDGDRSFDISKELSPIESRKVSAELALSAAETVLNIVLGDGDILSVLKYVPIHIHIMLYYAALLILKPHSCLNGANQIVDKVVDDDSRFESSINSIKLVKRLRHSIIVNSPTDKEFSGKIVDGLTSILHDKVRQMKQDIITGITDVNVQQRRLQMLDKVILDNDARELYNHQLKRAQNFKISAWPGFDAGHPTKKKD